jgi:hypothetical protein
MRLFFCGGANTPEFTPVKAAKSARPVKQPAGLSNKSNIL